ncbi:MAG TPA: hypothetical protein VGR28_14970 [Candidatus Thermoplasmatota archaeon]|jgi:hypothetical protein|nr:hypothetical protein [Candidatus Thermoplasmatota archaeon]
MQRSARPLVALALAALLAGCTAPAAQQSSLRAPAAVAPMDDGLPDLRLEGTACLEGGGHSEHPKIADWLPEPWLPADVQEDIGTQPVTTEFYSHPMQTLPEPNGTMGNYHATVLCDGWSLNGQALEHHVFGFVGMRIEAPPFDAGPSADRHYLITVLATSDHGLHELFHSLGFHATLTKGTAEWQAPDVFHNLLDTEDHGVYESIFTTKEVGPMPPLMRLWWQLENDDGTFSPIALDMANAGGKHLLAPAYGWFSHLRTHDHDPLPGAAGEISGLVYQDFDRVITLGPRPPVKLAEAYVHL